MALTFLVLRRLALGVVTLWLVSVVVFGATQLLPGDAARSVLGKESTPQAVAELRHQLGLDRPVTAQYASWLSGAVRGDFGIALQSRGQTAVITLIRSRIFNSAILVVCAALISIPVAVLLGTSSALWRDKSFDTIVTFLTLSLAALPEFVIGIILVLLFATAVFHVFPPVSRLQSDVPVWSQASLLVLPTLTLTLAVAPYITRMMRASTIEVLESDYIAMARLKGLPERTVLLRHAVPNAIVPAIQGTAVQLAWLAGGIVVVEYLFGYPGLGGLLVEAVSMRDLPVIQGVTLLIAVIYVITNLVADILSILVSPRLRTGLR
jgi:peptide/nickel transport system permease protein